MKIRDYIYEVIRFLPINELMGKITDTLDSQLLGEEGLAKVNKLIKLTNMILEELTSYFIPVYNTKTVNVVDNKVSYTSLFDNVVKIIKVEDDNGKEIPFKEKFEHVEINANRCKITYRYIPKELLYANEVEYAKKVIPTKVIVYGIIAEYCLTEGRFEEAVTWHTKYEEALNNILKPKNVNTKVREWE